MFLNQISLRIKLVFLGNIKKYNYYIQFKIRVSMVYRIQFLVTAVCNCNFKFSVPNIYLTLQNDIGISNCCQFDNLLLISIAIYQQQFRQNQSFHSRDNSKQMNRQTFDFIIHLVKNCEYEIKLTLQFCLFIQLPIYFLSSGKMKYIPDKLQINKIPR